MGIRMKKRWIATLDGRTRDSHRKLHGKTVDVDEKFPNGLMFPGDPRGDAKELYQCRCDMVAIVEGVNDEDMMTYSEWEAMKRAERDSRGGQQRGS